MVRYLDLIKIIETWGALEHHLRGYMKEVATNNFEFYECGEQSVSQSTVSSLENNSFPEEPLVSQETVSSPTVFNF